MHSVLNEELLLSAYVALKRIVYRQCHSVRSDAFFYAARKNFCIFADEILLIYEYLPVEFVFKLFFGEGYACQSSLGEAPVFDGYGESLTEQHKGRLRGLRVIVRETVPAEIQGDIQTEQPQRALFPFPAGLNCANRRERTGESYLFVVNSDDTAHRVMEHDISGAACGNSAHKESALPDVVADLVHEEAVLHGERGYLGLFRGDYIAGNAHFRRFRRSDYLRDLNDYAVAGTPYGSPRYSLDSDTELVLTPVEVEFAYISTAPYAKLVKSGDDVIVADSGVPLYLDGHNDSGEVQHRSYHYDSAD